MRTIAPGRAAVADLRSKITGAAIRSGLATRAEAGPRRIVDRNPRNPGVSIHDPRYRLGGY